MGSGTGVRHWGQALGALTGVTHHDLRPCLDRYADFDLSEHAEVKGAEIPCLHCSYYPRTMTVTVIVSSFSLLPLLGQEYIVLCYKGRHIVNGWMTNPGVATATSVAHQACIMALCA